MAFAGGGFLTSLEYLTVAEALVIHYTFPLAAIIGSLFITRERPTILQVVAGLLIVVGVYIGMGGSAEAMRSISLPGLLWGFLAVFGMAGQALVTRRFSLSHKMNEFGLLFYSNVFGIIMLFVFKSFYYGWGDLSLPHGAAVFDHDTAGLHWKSASLRRVFHGAEVHSRRSGKPPLYP